MEKTLGNLFQNGGSTSHCELCGGKLFWTQSMWDGFFGCTNVVQHLMELQRKDNDQSHPVSYKEASEASDLEEKEIECMVANEIVIPIQMD